MHEMPAVCRIAELIQLLMNGNEDLSMAENRSLAPLVLSFLFLLNYTNLIKGTKGVDSPPPTAGLTVCTQTKMHCCRHVQDHQQGFCFQVHGMSGQKDVPGCCLVGIQTDGLFCGCIPQYVFWCNNSASAIDLDWTIHTLLCFIRCSVMLPQCGCIIGVQRCTLAQQKQDKKIKWNIKSYKRSQDYSRKLQDMHQVEMKH